MAMINTFTVAPRKGDYPFTPYTHVYLSQYSQDTNGKVLLSPELMTDMEIDESVNWLIEQLEKARKKAKRDLKRKKGQLHELLQK